MLSHQSKKTKWNRPVHRSKATTSLRTRNVCLLAAGFCCWLVLTISEPIAAAADPQPEPIVFHRDIRPILSDACFHCHGPDNAKRQGELRLDTGEGVFEERDGYRVIVPGDVDKSELYRRLVTDDEDERMPPADSVRKLSDREIGLIARWIEQDAQWQAHWSFIPPRRPQVPSVKDTSWLRNAIDAFVLSRLEAEGLAPSPEATKSTLVRRVTLDLTGLPPTPAEVDAFLADPAENAYEKLVDRLLASPRYGERMAVSWLDAARYADTNGYQSDGDRIMWRWRDWVIDAFNRNAPYDEFTVDQLAGDLLPDPTLDQLIATGFNRNHRGNGEGGVIAEEYAVEYVVDRVDTTSTVWLGLTMACGRCHEHKYDPFSQKEFYEFFAFFNNVPERGRAFKHGNSPPTIKAPTWLQQERLDDLQRKLAAATDELERLEPQLAQAQREWEESHALTEPVNFSVSDGLITHFPLDGSTEEATGHIQEKAKSDSQDEEKTEEVVPASPPKPPHFGDGLLGQAALFQGEESINAGNFADFDYVDKFSLAAWIDPGELTDGTLLSRINEIGPLKGYDLRLDEGKLQLNLVTRWLDDALRVETKESLQPNGWRHVLVTYDGSKLAAGIKMYVNGLPQPIEANLDELNQSFQVAEPFRIGSGSLSVGRYRGSIDDVRVYDRVLSREEIELVATPDSIDKLVALDSSARTETQAAKLRAYYLAHQAPEPIQQAHRRAKALEAKIDTLIDVIPTTMVMIDREDPKETFLLVRGQYDKPGEKVVPNVPGALPPLPENAARNRFGFARWLVNGSNPLTARVAVNRYWQTHFGMGLVKTVEDFGSQGERPSHPELLDWLAVEFVDGAWNVKVLQRAIVTSATYRQSSKVTTALYNRDPENRLFARAPRRRLPAEMVRDQALALSGLLVEQLGGPSVKPYQPAGLWEELSGNSYQPDHGAGLYRRSLYTFWKRTAPPPSMMTFDSAGREMCTVRQTRTNTPLQALVLMNDVTYVEAARVLAERVMTSPDATAAERIAEAFYRVTSRQPRSGELDILQQGFDRYLGNYRENPAAAKELVSLGESPPNETLEAAELAAYTAVTSLILNLDEVVTSQ